MKPTCNLELYLDGAWRDAAAVDLTGDAGRGIDASTVVAYTSAHAIDCLDRRDAAALSAALPVSLTLDILPGWPAFLVDLLPQGYGRREVLKQLQRPEYAEREADWALLLAGAGNPVGNVRVREAHHWALQRTGDNPRGFTMDEVASRAGDFNEYLAQHGLFLAGSSGVQGEWPKILLTRAHDGLFYLDHTLPDHQADEHFIVKFGRGDDPRLADILRLEAPYMQLAAMLGLNVHRPLTLVDRALFIPRFDRAVADGIVLRHGQESVAAFCELTGFGVAPTHNEVCRRLGLWATDPLADVIEYVRRDLANIALGNKDNHGRNTAIQRRQDGTVALAPLFDFAPMWLHPDGIARKMRWERDDGGSPQWASAIAQAAQAAGLDEAAVRQGVRTMAEPLARVYQAALDLGIDEQAFLKPIEKSLLHVRAQLEAL